MGRWDRDDLEERFVRWRFVERQQFLQISAPISPGSSGGALFNLEGKVIGITTVASFWLAQNLNFAVPINSLKSLIGETARE
jgi:S1-C subfamily serine protease